jgi:cytoskeletal protein CcmA (bactofilin family)
LVTAGEIQVDSIVEGDIAATKITIGERAQVRGEIVAEVVIVEGEISGSVRARQVELAHTAKVHGDICHETLAIEAGAHVDGLLKHENFRPKAGAGEFDGYRTAADRADASADEAADLHRLGAAVA